MRIKNTVIIAAKLLGLDEVAAKMETGSSGGDTEKRLVEAARRVIDEIYSEHLPLIEEEDVTVSGGKALYSALRLKIIRPISLKRLGRRVRYTELPDRIETEKDGVYRLRYEYLPETGSGSVTAEHFSGKVSDRLAAYGVAADYCLILGMTDEAATWNKLFVDGIYRIVLPKGGRLPAKGWL